jgi:hypothetical protein
MRTLQLRPERTVILMGTLWCCMVFAYAATQYYSRHIAPAKIERLEAAGHKLDDVDKSAILNPRGLVKLFDVDGEQNIPALYQTLSLGFIAVLLFAIAAQRKSVRDPLALYWKVLACMFVFLMLDEGCSIHNNFHVYSAHTKLQQQKQGMFYFSWTLAYGVLMLPVGLWYLRFLFKLPRTYGIRIFVAGVVYVMGALGLEMILGDYLAHGGSGHSRMQLVCTTIEESMEMLGMLLFIHVLLHYMIENAVSFSVVPTAGETGHIAMVDLPLPGGAQRSGTTPHDRDKFVHAV